MTTAIINGKTYNITSHVFKRTFSDVMKLGLTEHVEMFKELAKVTGQKISNKAISVVDIDAGFFYSNISLGDYAHRVTVSKWVYDSIVTEKGYRTSVRNPEIAFSPITHMDITGHRFVFAADCPIEYLENIYKSVSYQEENKIPETNFPKSVSLESTEGKKENECLADKIVTKNYNNSWYPTECYTYIRGTLWCVEALRKVLDVIVERLANGEVVTKEDISYLEGEVESLSENMNLLIWNEIVAEKKIVITKGIEEKLLDEAGLTAKQLFEILHIESDN